MGRKLKFPVEARWLAQKLDLPFVGGDAVIHRVDSASEARRSSFCFVKNDSWLARVNRSAIVLIDQNLLCDEIDHGILSSSPRLDFARALNILDKQVGFEWSSDVADIHPTAKIGQFCVIGHGVKIGANTVICNNVTIGDEVEIGQNCRIKSGAVIGEEGFGFERDDEGSPIRLPHIGTVVIGNDVEIGSLTTVCRGTLSNTVISNGAKIDDHVHIAHNVIVGSNSFVIACAEISGGVKIGERAWIAPGASVLNQLAIGDDAIIGLGAVVVKSVPASSTVAGNPAKPLIPKQTG